MIIVQCNKRPMRRDDMLEGVKRVEKELDRMPGPEPRKRHRGQCVTGKGPKGVEWLAVHSVCGE